MSNRRILFELASGIAIVLSAATAPALAAELDPAAVSVLAPQQFKWRDPTDRIATNQANLYGDPTKAGLYIYINRFKPGRIGNPHYHPNDRFITVIDGESWHGTGDVVDVAHAERVPKGSFLIDHAGKVHWGGTKDETGAYLIAGIGPGGNIEVPKGAGPWTGGDPSAATIMRPDQIPWRDHGSFRVANLSGDSDKRGLFVQMLMLPRGNNFSRPHVHPGALYSYVLSGTWWVGSGPKYDPDNLAVPVKPGTFVTHFGNRTHWDGAKDEDVTLVIIGEGPMTTAWVDETP